MEMVAQHMVVQAGETNAHIMAPIKGREICPVKLVDFAIVVFLGPPVQPFTLTIR
jgi:hypothetical protein